MSPARLPVAFIHHANQLVIGDHYQDRDGITSIAAGYTAVLAAHRDLGVPMALHLSGTLVEALAWHHPQALADVRAGYAEGWLRLIGGCYCEAIMSLQPPAANRRQLMTMDEVLARHLGVGGEALPSAWLPERVWNPSLVDALTDPALPGGGPRRLFVDDRVLADPAGRTHFDAQGPYGWKGQVTIGDALAAVDPALLVPRLVGQSDRKLTLVPLCAALRYLIPARSGRGPALISELAAALRAAHPPADMLLVYGDDLERAAGVGGWEPALDGYTTALRAILASRDLVPVQADDWLDEHPAGAGPMPHAGTYYELAVEWQAGEDYLGWAGEQDWAPYASLAARVEESLAVMVPGADHRLVKLAERLAMVAAYESAWRDGTGTHTGTLQQRHLAGWVRACAEHGRLAHPVLAAARWAASGCAPCSTLSDADGDDGTELILGNRDVWALVSPEDGARVCLLIHRRPQRNLAPSADSPGAALIAGNPIDHWNLQEEPYRYMDAPAGHPGALADLDAPHGRWSTSPSIRRSDFAVVSLRRLDGPGSRTYALLDGVPALAACLRGPGPLRIASLLAADYLGMLEGGSAEVRATGGPNWRGVQWRNRHAWIGFDPRQAEVLDSDGAPAWHGRLVALCAQDGHLDVLLGAGDVTQVQVDNWLADVASPLHDSVCGASRSLELH